jgi:hypothetical protein
MAWHSVANFRNRSAACMSSSLCRISHKCAELKVVPGAGNRLLDGIGQWPSDETIALAAPSACDGIEKMRRLSPNRNSRLAAILFATSLIIVSGSAAMAMTLDSPAFQQNGRIPRSTPARAKTSRHHLHGRESPAAPKPRPDHR